LDSMNYLTTIDVTSPRYLAQVSESKAYVTDWGDNGVHVLNLDNNTISTTISCGIGPEAIVVNNGYAYVCNVGGWGLDNTVSIINISTDIVETILNVGDKPNSLVVDANGAIWVLSGGYTEWNADWTQILSQTNGTLVKIVNNSIEKTFEFPLGSSPSNLVINDAGTDLYFSNGSIFNMSIADLDLPTIPLVNKSFYSLGYNDGYIFGTDVMDYVQQGWSYRYTSSGSVVDSVQVGIIPGGYCFNN